FRTAEIRAASRNGSPAETDHERGEPAGRPGGRSAAGCAMTMDRRTFLQSMVPAAGALLVAGSRCAMAVSPQAAQLTTTALSEQLMLISGAGGNVVVFNSPEGVLLVDGGAPEHSAALLSLVQERTGAARIHTL